MNRKLIPILFAVMLVTLACGISVPHLPTPGALVTEQVEVPAPTPALSGAEVSGETRLTLAFGAGKLYVAPGAQGMLVQGSATYNYSELKPNIKTSDGNIRVQTGDGNFKTFPAFRDLTNIWDLKLGDAPIDLTIEAGAYDAVYDLGGLALTNLTIKDGASDVKVNFSAPNRTTMSILRYETGASTVKLTGLANANFGTLLFNGGAGDYTLDFSGQLQRDAAATVECGFSNIILIIPAGVHAVVTTEGGVSNVNAGPGWVQNGNVYTQAGDGPTLTILVKTGAANLTLTR